MAFENNYTGFRSGGYVDTQSPTGDILGNLALGGLAGVAGNLAGNYINYRFNRELQENQMDNQIELQNRAFKHNQTAVQQQARLQALGKQQAGLSAADVSGQGAPSLQSGAAAGGTSAMSNVFSGIADLIAAIKAPTEIEKAVAETELAKSGAEKQTAETEQLIPAQVSHLLQGADDVAQRVRAAKNANEMFEAHRDFVKSVGPSIFDGYRGMLKQAGVYEKLPIRTRQTIDSLADGEIDLGPGEIEGLNSIVNSQANLSTRDKELFRNLVDTVTSMNQATNKATMDALSKLPLNQQNLMRSQVAEYYAMAGQAKSQADLNKLNKWLEEHTSDQWLIENGMSDEIERKKYTEVFNNLMKFSDPTTYTGVLGGAIGGSMIGRSLRGGSSASKMAEDILKNARKEGGGLTPGELQQLEVLKNFR